jgi:hypothetical protein
MDLDPKTVARNHGRNYATLLIETTLASAPENMTPVHAKAYAEILVNALGDTAIRMRRNGLSAELGVMWFRAAINAARERLRERSGERPARPDHPLVGHAAASTSCPKVA